jgi:hypothetical protein
MNASVLTIIASVLALIIGLWKKYGRIAAEKRKLSDEAGKELEDAQKNKDKSGRLDAWGKINRT